LKIITFNTLGIPLITKNYGKRFDALVKEISNIRPDVVCLQEVWMQSMRKRLKSELYESGFIYSSIPASGYRLNGLVTFSRYPIKRSDYFSLKPLFSGFNSSLIEFPGDKGCLLTHIEVEDKEVDICNIHLNADFSISGRYEENSVYGKINSGSLRKLSSLIGKIGDNKLIICGDFNFEPGSSPHREFSILTEADDRIPFGFSTMTKKLFFFPAPSRGNRVDYIFTKNIDDGKIRDVGVIWDDALPGVGYLSDHAGLMLDIAIEE
jgi:endonuclease/exonuclease/phosphatase family metal-dependent hydrolase